MKEIKLTRGETAIVDDEYFDTLNSYKWHCAVHQKMKNKYAARWVRSENGKQIKIYMHRQIIGAEKGEQTDHVDGNGLNNQKSNIRKCSSLQNQHNRRKFSETTSKFKGVWLDTGKWRAAIRYYGKLKHLGTFKSEIEASRAYDNAAVELFGEFANTNEKSRCLNG